MRITLSLPEAVDKDLEALATMTGRTKSDLVREGIERTRDEVLRDPATKALHEMLVARWRHR